MGEEGDGNKYICILSDALLLVAGGWGVQSIKEHPFAGTAFGLYAIKGLAGLLSRIVDDENIKKVKTHISTWVRSFGIPLIATEITRGSCVPIEFAALYFLVPIGDLLATETDKEIDPVFRNVSLGHTIGIMTVIKGCNDCPRFYQNVLFALAFGIALATETQIGDDYSGLLFAVAVVLTWLTMTEQLPF